jgi:hypothetical protein
MNKMSELPKYFLYISDAKVSMLHEQIEHPMKTITTAIKGGAGRWLGIEVSSEFNTSQSNLYKKLTKVCKWIRKKEEVSTMDNINSAWVEDTFLAYVSYPVESSLGTPVMVIQWQDEMSSNPLSASKHLLLVGSAAYMMPRDRDGETGLTPLQPGGHWPEVNRILEKILKEEKEQNDKLYWVMGSQDGPFGPEVKAKPTVIRSMFRVLQKLETTGKNEKAYYLGTPLYVEIVE